MSKSKKPYPTGLLYNVERWRSRAERARAVAEKIADAHSRETMVRIANYYERMAQLAERLKKTAPQKDYPIH
jgi:cytochrome c553